MRTRAALLSIAIAAGAVMPAGAQEQLSLSLATATPGGGFPVYGAALVDALRSVDPTLSVVTRNTGGSAENVPLLEQRAVDLALVQGDAAFTAMSRSGSPLRIVAAMYATAGLFVVRADSPYRSIQDLVGKPVAFGARGSGLVVLARKVLEGIGLDPDRDFTPVYLERAGDGPAMVADGRVAALWGGGAGWPGFLAVARQPGGARFISPSSAELQGIRARHPDLHELEVAAGTYPGQDQALMSVGSWSLILSHADLNPDAAYRFARALHQARQAFASRLPQAAESTVENTVRAAVKRETIHPGVLRYLREIKLID